MLKKEQITIWNFEVNWMPQSEIISESNPWKRKNVIYKDRDSIGNRSYFRKRIEWPILMIWSSAAKAKVKPSESRRS